jgi:hypothetical protein
LEKLAQREASLAMLVTKYYLGDHSVVGKMSWVRKMNGGEDERRDGPSEIPGTAERNTGPKNIFKF